MSAPSERGLSGKVSGLDREPTAGELGIADGPSDEYRSGPSEPPVDLPATLASVDDVRRVCEAAGLTGWDGGYRDQRVLVYAPRGPNDEDDQVEVRSPAVSGTPPVLVTLALDDRTPGSLLYAAIQAARSAS